MIDSSASNVIIVKAKIDDETLEPSYFFHSLDNVQPIEIQGKKVCLNLIGTLSARGVARAPRNLADQLTLFKPREQIMPIMPLTLLPTPRIQKAIYTSVRQVLTLCQI